ncbi:hypothetical protein SS50377_23984 [Spironucleus salmonicida]|uniref:Uncharacterized protein n=1 Tax=Spironucleus salmonicida TaxID=348837 RepID=A0A9P8LU18_9EUKA|nr:hypothetical protein SS50377_23984 [Spironucleus salmonicida]
MAGSGVAGPGPAIGPLWRKQRAGYADRRPREARWAYALGQPCRSRAGKYCAAEVGTCRSPAVRAKGPSPVPAIWYVFYDTARGLTLPRMRQNPRMPRSYIARRLVKDLAYFRAFQSVLEQEGYTANSPQVACLIYEWIRQSGELCLNDRFMARVADQFNDMKNKRGKNALHDLDNDTNMSNTAAAQYYMKTFSNHYGSMADNRERYMCDTYDWFVSRQSK